ncbi:MAG: hypothetical protein R3E60_02225 [Alphaproteobacteria bacterium]
MMNKTTLSAFAVTLGLWGLSLIALSFFSVEPMNTIPGIYEPSGTFARRQEPDGGFLIVRGQRPVVVATTPETAGL